MIFLFQVCIPRFQPLIFRCVFQVVAGDARDSKNLQKCVFAKLDGILVYLLAWWMLQMLSFGMSWDLTQTLIHTWNKKVTFFFLRGRLKKNCMESTVFTSVFVGLPFWYVKYFYFAGQPLGFQTPGEAVFGP